MQEDCPRRACGLVVGVCLAVREDEGGDTRSSRVPCLLVTLVSLSSWPGGYGATPAMGVGYREGRTEGWGLCPIPYPTLPALSSLWPNTVSNLGCGGHELVDLSRCPHRSQDKVLGGVVNRAGGDREQPCRHLHVCARKPRSEPGPSLPFCSSAWHFSALSLWNGIFLLYSVHFHLSTDEDFPRFQ